MRNTLFVLLAVMFYFAITGCAVKQSVQPEYGLGRDVILLNDDGRIYNPSVEKVVEEVIPVVEAPAPVEEAKSAEISVLQETKTQIDKINEKVEKIVKENGYSEKDIEAIDSKEFIAEVQRPLFERISILERRGDAHDKSIADLQKKTKGLEGLAGKVQKLQEHIRKVEETANINATKNILWISPFKSGSATLSKEQEGEIAVGAEYAKGKKIDRRVVAFADTDGDKESNEKYCLARAKMAAIHFAKLAGFKSDYFEPVCGGITDAFGDKRANRAAYFIEILKK